VPKGCRVARRAAGNRVTERISKSGATKPLKRKIRATGNNLLLPVRHNGRTQNLMYDTGATYSVLRPAQARQLRILDANDRLIAPGATEGQPQNMLTAGGQQRMRKINNVQFMIPDTGESTRGTVMIHQRLAGAGLLGLGHIKGLRLLKVKFRRA
jgi:predicted aspartyl protease